MGKTMYDKVVMRSTVVMLDLNPKITIQKDVRLGGNFKG